VIRLARDDPDDDFAMTASFPALPLPAADLERTCLPTDQATMLPGAAFTDYAVFEWERANVFGQGWICAGHVEQVGRRGAFLTLEVAGENVLIVGDDEGLPRAFLNTCRHRGARLVVAPHGTLRRIQCSYHAWTYGFDGSLRNAPFTEGLADFDPKCFALHEVRLAVVEGLVLLDLGGEAPPAQDHVGDLAPLLARYRTADLQRGARIVYDVDANWKAIGENYSECLHCPGVHPELNRLSHYLSGEAIEGAGQWCGGSMTLAEGVETMATGGGRGREPIAGADLRSILYFLLFPNTLISLHPDYVMLHTLWPKGPDRTEVVCEWYFEPEAVAAPDFDPADAVGFWDQVNREDWEVCALTQRGMESRSFTPGRYTTREGDVHTFDVMVAERYLAALR
jgi:Rieske 2Fe-2S family protein